MADHGEVLLDALQLLVSRNEKAQFRWDELTAEELKPLLDWVCEPRTLRAGQGRVKEGVQLLARPTPEVSGGVSLADLLSPPGFTGPSIFDAF